MHGRNALARAPAAALHRRVREGFVTHFGQPPSDAAFAPGRVNLIGEHIDYCGGTVLPMPIQHGTWAFGARTGRATVRAVTLDGGPAVEIDPAAGPTLPAGHWGRFVIGAVAVANLAGDRPGGLDLCVAGDIPGSGLSSSASLSIALLQVIGRLYGHGSSGLALARAAQRIEHEFVGVDCGLMDQAAIVLGAEHCAVLFDCATDRHRQVPLDDALAIVVADTGVRRALADSAYNERRSEVERIAARSSVEVSRLAPALAAARPFLDDPLLRRRAAHVASEQARVMQAADALGHRDHNRFGALLNESHASLRDDYQVSCAELDLLAEAFARQPGCHGARMTGGGFGGCVVAAVDADRLSAVIQAATRQYADRTGIRSPTFRARAAGGARIDG